MTQEDLTNLGFLQQYELTENGEDAAAVREGPIGRYNRTREKLGYVPGYHPDYYKSEEFLNKGKKSEDESEDKK